MIWLVFRSAVVLWRIRPSYHSIISIAITRSLGPTSILHTNLTEYGADSCRCGLSCLLRVRLEKRKNLSMIAGVTTVVCSLFMIVHILNLWRECLV